MVQTLPSVGRFLGLYTRSGRTDIYYVHQLQAPARSAAVSSQSQEGDQVEVESRVSGIVIIMAVPSAVYQDVIDWALAQQTHDSSNDGAAPLTAPQRKALLLLHGTIKPPPCEPEVGDSNWVGLLNRKFILNTMN